MWWFFYSRQTRGSHSFYAMKQVFMEIITAAYTMGQWHLISYYFGFNWYLAIKNANYMSELFPVNTFCKHERKGPNQLLIKTEEMCVLNFNSLYVKVLQFLAIWMIICYAVAILYSLYRILTLTNKEYRVDLILSQVTIMHILWSSLFIVRLEELYR